MHSYINIVATIPDHLRSLANNLRPEDEHEIIAFGVSPNKALWRSYKNSIMARTAIIDDKVAACWGCAGIVMGDVGTPWLLTSPYVKRVSSLKFVKIYQQEVYDMLKFFPRLENYVCSSYASAIRLLDIIGFTIESPIQLGKYHEEYCRFSIGK